MIKKIALEIGLVFLFILLTDGELVSLTYSSNESMTHSPFCINEGNNKTFSPPKQIADRDHLPNSVIKKKRLKTQDLSSPSETNHTNTPFYFGNTSSQNSSDTPFFTKANPILHPFLQSQGPAVPYSLIPFLWQSNDLKSAGNFSSLPVSYQSPTTSTVLSINDSSITKPIVDMMQKIIDSQVNITSAISLLGNTTRALVSEGILKSLNINNRSENNAELDDHFIPMGQYDNLLRKQKMPTDFFTQPNPSLPEFYPKPSTISIPSKGANPSFPIPVYSTISSVIPPATMMKPILVAQPEVPVVGFHPVIPELKGYSPTRLYQLPPEESPKYSFTPEGTSKSLQPIGFTVENNTPFYRPQYGSFVPSAAFGQFI